MKIKLRRIKEFLKKRKVEAIFVAVFVLFAVWVLIVAPPKQMRESVLLTIEEGDSLKVIAQKLKDYDLIRSKTIFSSILIIQGKDNKIAAGEYLFEKSQGVFDIVERVVKGEYGFDTKTITLTEGLTLDQMANIFEDEFPKFNRNKFEIETSLYEGYLFPDTYTFSENVDANFIARKMIENFNEKIDSIKDIIEKSDKSLREIIIMASIVEKEATSDSRQQVSDILWHRMEIGMPLQVDATFVYERGKGTFDLTTADLRDDSPYNTYTNAGLPPTPISNPGLESIKAAANPQPTEYLFFLTGNDGEMYYAKTHDEHVANKEKFLNG